MQNLEEANKIIHKAFESHSKGNILEAVNYYEYFIRKGFKDCRVFSNYGVILRSLGKLKEAEILYRKAIELNPDFVKAYHNLGSMLRDLGKLKEAKLCSKKIMSIRSWSILGSYSFNR